VFRVLKLVRDFPIAQTVRAGGMWRHGRRWS
jgi:hypothetical protein